MMTKTQLMAVCSMVKIIIPAFSAAKRSIKAKSVSRYCTQYSRSQSEGKGSKETFSTRFFCNKVRRFFRCFDAGRFGYQIEMLLVREPLHHHLIMRTDKPCFPQTETGHNPIQITNRLFSLAKSKRSRIDPLMLKMKYSDQNLIT